MQSGAIPDEDISASSSFDSGNVGPQHARLVLSVRKSIGIQSLKYGLKIYNYINQTNLKGASSDAKNLKVFLQILLYKKLLHDSRHRYKKQSFQKA